MQYDVIVVGAGPAGSTTARECARRGLSVLLLDKAEFPRDKPCGGAVTVRAARLLPFTLAPVTERVIAGVRFSLRQAGAFTRHAGTPLAHLTQRRHLDLLLVERATEAGAMLRQRAPVREVTRGRTGVVVRAGGETFEARTLVAADGANGRTATLAGLTVPRWMAVALEANITPPGGVAPEWAEVFAMDLGALPHGYAWLFPKGDHVNLGVGGWTYVGPRLRASLERTTRYYGLDPSEYWGLRGHHLPIRQPGAPLVDGNLLLVGDAAGLLDPFTYEGIYGAIWSGRAAAQHLAAYLGGQAATLDGYRDQAARDLLPELRIAGRTADLFELVPKLYLQLARSVGWPAMRRLTRGELTYVQMNRLFGPLAVALDFLADALRASPWLQRRAGLEELRGPERFLRGTVAPRNLPA